MKALLALALITSTAHAVDNYPPGDPQFPGGPAGKEFSYGTSFKLYWGDGAYPDGGWRNPKQACKEMTQLMRPYDTGDRYYCHLGLCSDDASLHEMLMLGPVDGSEYSCFSYPRPDLGEKYVSSARYQQQPPDTCGIVTDGVAYITKSFRAKCGGECWKDKAVLLADTAWYDGDGLLTEAGPDGMWDSQRKIQDCAYNPVTDWVRCETSVDYASFQNAIGDGYGSTVNFQIMRKSGAILKKDCIRWVE